MKLALIRPSLGCAHRVGKVALVGLAALLLLGLATVPVVAAEWPTYLHDNARSGISSEALELPLQEHWVYTPAAPPDPAWATHTMCRSKGFWSCPA